MTMNLVCRCVHCTNPVSLPMDEFRDRLNRSESIAEYDGGNVIMLCGTCSEKHLNQQEFSDVGRP